MVAVTKEIATKEITAWLDYKRIKQSVRDNKAKSIGILVDAMIEGDITISQGEYHYNGQKLTGPVITQSLIFPVGSLTSISYKPRETMGALSSILSKASGGATMGTVYAEQLSIGSIMGEQLLEMDNEDGKVMNAIVEFFL
jgi:hypothetical protein